VNCAAYLGSGWGGRTQRTDNYPVKFPVSREKQPESSSLKTACTAIQFRCGSKFWFEMRKAPIFGALLRLGTTNPDWRNLQIRSSTSDFEQ
jgi:hypothetical protein